MTNTVITGTEFTDTPAFVILTAWLETHAVVRVGTGEVRKLFILVVTRALIASSALALIAGACCWCHALE